MLLRIKLRRLTYEIRYALPCAGRLSRQPGKLGRIHHDLERKRI